VPTERSAAPDPAPVLDYEPAWSSDGKQIAFMRGWPARLEVFTMNRDGTHQRPLRNPRIESAKPSWAPIDQRVALLGWNNKNLYVVRPDGRGKKRLAGRASTLDNPPAWSPSGTAIAFEGDSEENIFDLYVIRTDGAGRPKLLSAGGNHPSWSPDSQMIAFSRYDKQDNCVCVYVIGADGSGPRRVTDGSSPALQPRLP
jgi:Tol biopolymer transport system component